jgi:hypothetical protein
MKIKPGPMVVKRHAFSLLIILIILSPQDLAAQLKLNAKVSATNLFRWGKGKQITLGDTTTKEYLEETADVRLFVNDFLFGVRYEFDEPIEYGTSIKGISRRFVEFNKDQVLVRAGNYYELFEKGLTLNAFENRPLGFNTQLDGLKLRYGNQWKNLKFDGTIVGGDMNYSDYLVPDRVETYSIRAANLNFSPFRFVGVGGSYLYTRGSIPSGSYITNITAEIAEGNLKFSYKGFDFFASYANKKTITDPNQLYPVSLAPRGDGFYGMLSYTREGLGAVLEYKNYRFDLVTPDERSNTRPTKALPFQQPPTLIKEHNATLLSRYPHIVDFNDEVGYQLEAFYSPTDNLTFNLNISQTSRHYDYQDVDTTALTRYQRIDRKFSWMPALDDAMSPFWEIYLEAEYYYKTNLKLKLGVARQTSILYNIIDPGTSEKIRTFTVPLEVRYDFLKKYSVKLNAEVQKVFNLIRSDQKSFWNTLIAVTLSRSPDIGLTGYLELSNDEEDPSGRKYWPQVEAVYKISSANAVQLSYGNERGGLKCSSGICRYVSPFNGFRLTVINNFN